MTATQSTSSMLGQQVSSLVETSITITETFTLFQRPDARDAMVWQWRHFAQGPCGNIVINMPHIATTPSEFEPPCCPPSPGLADGKFSGGYRNGCPIDEVFRNPQGDPILAGC
eukprot:CAMPEP_0119390690 /NCGR_PEP_ID=MMETSP1334-20130426/114337_1 /TAXON_ID=127549 /ORGANISM="Calcidiscus leptoporus, Strain RCC1130" /LENGTH=112 /DNA_ID=CAMNT_0007413245 /DNA_START=6 /DNA_END=344 /DNA_ORIENTATION=-